MFYIRAFIGGIIGLALIAGGLFLGVQSPRADDQQAGVIAIVIGIAIIALTLWLIWRRKKGEASPDLVTTNVPDLDPEDGDVGGDEPFLSLDPTGKEDPAPAGPKAFGAARARHRLGEDQRIQAAMANAIANREGPLFEAIMKIVGPEFQNLTGELALMREALAMRDEASELTFQAAMDAAAKSLDPTALPDTVKADLIQASGGALAAFLQDWKGDRPLGLIDLPRNVVMPLCVFLPEDDKLRARLIAGAQALGENWEHFPDEVVLAFEAMYQLRLAEGKEVWENILSLPAHQWSAETLFRTLEEDEKEALMLRLEDGEPLENLNQADIDQIEELLESTMVPAAPAAVAQEETDPVRRAVAKMLEDLGPDYAPYGQALLNAEPFTVENPLHMRNIRVNLPNALSSHALSQTKAREVCDWLGLRAERVFSKLFAEDDTAPTPPPAPGAEGGGDKLPGLFDLPEDDAPERDIVAVMANSLREIGQTGLGDGVGDGNQGVTIPSQYRQHFRERFAKDIGDQRLTSAEIEEVKTVIADAESVFGDLLKPNPSDIRSVLEGLRVLGDEDGGQ